MTKLENKHCPNCNNSFICKVDDIVNCQCNTINLTEAAIKFLSTTGFDCLCKDCLTKMNETITS